MATDKPSWYSISSFDEMTYDVFRIIPKAGTNALYAIDAADKAMAVPFIKIWQLAGGMYSRTNQKLEPALSDQFTSTPRFGDATQFAERPVASIESVNVKVINPGGWILYREIDISLVVHRPDVLNSATGAGNVVHALLTPGNSFVLEYGWAGGRNPVLGPGQSRKEQEPELNPEEEAKVARWRAESDSYPTLLNRTGQPAPKPEFYGTVFTATDQVRFVVVNYNFSIAADNQLRFSIKAVEDAELQIRNTTIFDQDGVPEPPISDGRSNPVQDAAEYLQRVTDYFSSELAALAVDTTVMAEKSKGDGQKQPTVIKTVALHEVLDLLFAGPITKGITDLGYKDVHLYTGVFNKNAPHTTEAFGSMDWADAPIGMFRLRLEDVQKILNQVVATKNQITVYNLLKQVLGLMMNPGAWELTAKDASMPELQVFTLFNPRAGHARIQIVDRKRYLTIVQGAGEVNEHTWTDVRDQVRRKLQSFLAANPSIPYFTLFHQGSFFKDAKFEVVNDELMKSIFMNRQIQKTREQIASGAQSETETNGGVPQGLLLYRSAIKGTVQLLGNFAFHLLGHVWFNFGVPRLDGLFYILSKVDKVDRDGFTSTLTLQAEGSNPLGIDPPRAAVAEDWIKEKMQRTAAEVPAYLKKGPPGSADTQSVQVEVKD